MIKVRCYYQAILDTKTVEIEECFNAFVKRKEISIIIISKSVRANPNIFFQAADQIREAIKKHGNKEPEIVEIPSR